MSALGSKLRQAEDGKVLFWCPGCDGAHGIRVGDGSGPFWGWNGSGDAPTFTPSILVQGVQPMTQEQRDAWINHGTVPPKPKPLVCHSYVTDGRIQFLGDCTHALAGQTVDLPDFDS